MQFKFVKVSQEQASMMLSEDLNTMTQSGMVEYAQE